LLGEDVGNLDENLPNVQLFAIKMVDKYLKYIVHFLSTGIAPSYFIVA
jgi:hypothetical protein